MKRSYTVPEDFQVTDRDREWAKDTFNIDDKEVDRQIMFWRLHEYKRAYFDWGRALQRWFYQAKKYKELIYEHKPRTIVELTPEQAREERIRGDENLKRLAKMALKVVK